MKEENKVLVITNMFPSKQQKSFGIFIKNQVDALRQRGLDVDVAAITNPKSGKMQLLKKYGKWLFELFLTFVVKGRAYQVVHAHYVFPSGYFGLFFKRLYKSRLVVTAHGGDLDKMAKKGPWFFKMTKTILHKADHVIAVGEGLYQQIVTDFSVNPDKVSVISMGVNRQIFKPLDRQAAKGQCGLASDTKTILFVGNIIEQKGLLDLIEAMVIIHHSRQNIQLMLIGPEKDAEFKHTLEGKITAGQLHHQVQFLGIKDQSDIALWLNAAECLVLPSHIEGFGLAALEAMACGTPVIGTDVGGLKHLLSQEAGLLVPARHPAELAKSILQVLLNEETAKHLIKYGLQKAEENDQERLLNRVMNVYFPTGG
jgi:glycosyltransferase involved in cell wall biosynthesis